MVSSFSGESPSCRLTNSDHGNPRRGGTWLGVMHATPSQLAGLQHAPILGAPLLIPIPYDVERPNSAW